MIHKTININNPLQNSHYTVNVCVTFHNQIMRIKHKYPALLYSDKWFCHNFFVYVLHMTKLMRGQTFTFRLENDYSVDNVCGSMLAELYILPINKAILYKKKLQLCKKPQKQQKFSPRNLLYMMYGVQLHDI